MAAAARHAITDPTSQSGPRLPVSSDPARTTPHHAGGGRRRPWRCRSAHPFRPRRRRATAAGPPPKPRGRRPRVLIGALAGVVLLIVAGVFAVIAHTARRSGRRPGAQQRRRDARHGHLRRHLPGRLQRDHPHGRPDGRRRDTVDGQVGRALGVPARPLRGDGLPPERCRARRCRAWCSTTSTEAGWPSASAQISATTLPSKSGTSFTLEPRPDGTLAGEYSGTSSDGCSGKGTVTFARTGSIDVNTLPDPAALPPRVVSPAEVLHGHYHLTRNFSNGSPQQDLLYTVGHRLSSHRRTVHELLPWAVGLPTADIQRREVDLRHRVRRQVSGQRRPHAAEVQRASIQCPSPRRTRSSCSSGHGHQEQTGNCAASTEVTETFTRTGD